MFCVNLSVDFVMKFAILKRHMFHKNTTVFVFLFFLITAKLLSIAFHSSKFSL